MTAVTAPVVRPLSLASFAGRYALVPINDVEAAPVGAIDAQEVIDPLVEEIGCPLALAAEVADRLSSSAIRSSLDALISCFIRYL